MPYTGNVVPAVEEVIAPAITTTLLSEMTEGQVVNQQLTATGTSPITWSVTAGTLPDGLSLSTSELISGYPISHGNYNFTVTATNSASSDTQVYNGSVAQIPRETVIASNLDIPWSIAFLPDDDMIVAEKTGTIRRIGKNPYSWDFSSQSSTEGGLMGLALDPNYASNNFIYTYYTVVGGGSNQVDKHTLVGNNLTFHSTLLSGIPAAAIHNGGVIKFGPDGKLYICVGDANDQNNAQDIHTMAGKILRINSDGTTPADNPFPGASDGRNEIWSYGHRNPQGLAWDSSGRLSTEHGPFPGEDEINLIEKGKNYGWPIIRGNMTQSGMETAKLQSTTEVTWAPSGCEIIGNKLYFATL